MKKLLIFSTLLIISGCQALQKASLPPQTAQASTGCPEKPKAALTKPEEIQLNSQSLVKSGQASADKSVGYTFTAQAGQKLSYRTNDDICIWIYAPDTQLLGSGELPQTGKYTLQVSAPKGSTTFNLEMSLGTLEASQPSASATTNDNSNSETSTSKAPIFSTSTTEVSDINQDEALELVQNWYKAKPRIFGFPFDRSLVEQYATEKLYQDTLKPNGSIDWLQNNSSYYTYENSQINKILSFQTSGDRPSLIVNISEELYLHGPRGIGWSRSKTYHADFIYFFSKDNGVWKISEYKKIG
ncbi:DUF4101 domain-containing protein [Chroococcidiopsidales cyanobacterium LEGE 13417]|nr:DUF4101 domain-containing protein [Chroococcidiopsidales cyanobacterium LEGE 13417]